MTIMQSSEMTTSLAVVVYQCRYYIDYRIKEARTLFFSFLKKTWEWDKRMPKGEIVIRHPLTQKLLEANRNSRAE